MQDYVEALRAQGRPVSEVFCPTSTPDLVAGLPFAVGPGANPGVILRSDTFLELGNPEAGSCAFVLWTDTPELVRNGRMSLIGPDIPDCPGTSLPFGQVIVVGGRELDEGVQERLDQAQFVADQIEGYMIRGASQHIWSRVSRQVAQKGFRFGTLAEALMVIFRSQVPAIETVEVLFVTSAREDLAPLDDIEEQVRKIARNIVSENWKARGVDLAECTFGWDCASCPDKEICDDIRDIIKIRKAGDTTDKAV